MKPSTFRIRFGFWKGKKFQVFIIISHFFLVIFHYYYYYHTTHSDHHLKTSHQNIQLARRDCVLLSLIPNV